MEAKEIINLFQFPQQRLTLEQISRDQQKVRLFPSDEADDPPNSPRWIPRAPRSREIPHPAACRDARPQYE